MNSVEEFYTNPMDIAQFLDGEKAEMLMRNIIRKAAIFHSKTGISPIVKAEDHDIYSLDPSLRTPILHFILNSIIPPIMASK